MKKPGAAQIGTARQLLVLEGASPGNAEECATAAARVYDKFHAHLSPLLGSSGVQALLVRSARRVQAEFALLTDGIAMVDSSTKLHAYLGTLDPQVAAQAAEALFGTFFTLLTTFIGERLTREALRRAWPTIDETTPTENDR
jgi:hypothetical protein